MKSRKIINVNSRDKDSGIDSDFSITVELPSQHKFNRICVLQALVPKTYYTIHEGQNTFTLIEDGKETTVTIEPANYNRKSLARVLAELLTLHSPNRLTYILTFPNANVEPDDGKYIFQVWRALPGLEGDGSPLQPVTDIPVAIRVPARDKSDIYEHLGFNAGSTNHFRDSKLKSTNVVKIQAEDIIRIHSSACNNGENDILLELYATTTPTFSNIIYNCPDIIAYSMPLTNVSTNSFRFRLTNEDDLPLSLNGLNFCLQLLLFEEQESQTDKIVANMLRNVGRAVL